MRSAEEIQIELEEKLSSLQSVQVADKVKRKIREEEYYHANLCINHTKKHFSWYFKGFNSASYWRKKFMQVTQISEIKSLLDKMEESLAIEIN